MKIELKSYVKGKKVVVVEEIESLELKTSVGKIWINEKGKGLTVHRDGTFIISPDCSNGICIKESPKSWPIQYN